MFKIQKLDFLIAFFTPLVVLPNLREEKTVPFFSLAGFLIMEPVTPWVFPFIY